MIYISLYKSFEYIIEHKILQTVTAYSISVYFIESKHKIICEIEKSNEFKTPTKDMATEFSPNNSPISQSSSFMNFKKFDDSADLDLFCGLRCKKDIVSNIITIQK